MTPIIRNRDTVTLRAQTRKHHNSPKFVDISSNIYVNLKFRCFLIYVPNVGFIKFVCPLDFCVELYLFPSSHQLAAILDSFRGGDKEALAHTHSHSLGYSPA